MSNIVPYNEMQSMSLSVAKSGMFGIKSEHQALTLMLIAEAEGLRPIQAVQMYSVINGMPSLKTTEMHSRYMNSGGKVIWIETTATNAKAKFIFENEELVFEYTWEDAKLAELTSKSNYKKMPKEMLRARCLSSGIRMSNPSCLNNLYSIEEMQDSMKETNVTTIQDVEVVEIVEVIPPKPMINTLKLKLANRLKEFSFSDGDIRDFANKYELSDNLEKLEELIEDNELLLEYVTEFEKMGE